ncbi:MAG: TetR family transcriptional regulator, partial [Planctomycetota bacterium]|nr:TetR family transcriptional regulator [Planctomycetota bacterium]
MPDDPLHDLPLDLLGALPRDRPLTEKGEATRARILDAAVELLRERGYDKTTMRAISRAASVSLGSAYHYFESKEHLIQAWYGRSLAEHVKAAEKVLAEETDFRKRLVGVMRAKIDSSEPYHRFAGVLFKTAADPKSPLNPFSPASGPVRADATALFEEVVRGAKLKVPADLRAELPRMLWMYQMGIILFWIHDDSPKRVRTHKFIEGTGGLVARLVKLASNPLLAPLRKTA